MSDEVKEIYDQIGLSGMSSDRMMACYTFAGEIEKININLSMHKQVMDEEEVKELRVIRRYLKSRIENMAKKKHLKGLESSHERFLAKMKKLGQETRADELQTKTQ